MNTTQIIKMCKEIYRDYRGMKRKPLPEDSLILDTIMRLYNTTEIDWEEVKWLWINYLEKGNLYLSKAMEMAEKRIAYEDMLDRMETEEELTAWLCKGI